MTTPLLKVKNLSVCFKQTTKDFCAVDDVSFELNQGEVLGIVGESGSGKSLTSLSILGLLPYPKAYHKPNSSILFEGEELLNSPKLNTIRGNDISFIFQEPMSSLNPLHTIEKQIAETLIHHQHMSPSTARREVLRLLKMTGIQNARQRMKAYPFELSGGQRQRVMIAMAIANHPKILIADEPTTALDVTIQAQILDLLLNLRQKLNMAIIFISHDLNVIRKIADRVCVMHAGKIVECGQTEDIFKNPQQSYTKTLINSIRPLKNNTNERGMDILRVSNLSVVFPLQKNFWGKVTKELKAVDSVSFSLKQGQTLGIVGESGSGKTTLGLALCKLINFNGSVEYIDITEKNFHKKIQIVFQDPYNSLNPRMNIEEIIGEGLLVHFSHLNKVEKHSRIIKVLQEVGLEASDLNKYPHEFSGGQRQRIAIARALILEPQILILDEPTSALDITIQAQILKLLQDIQKSRGLSYIFISHDMHAVYAISDQIAVMKNGQIIERSNRDAIFQSPQNPYTQQLIKASS